MLVGRWGRKPSRNWGDALNPIIIKHLSGVEPTFVDVSDSWFNKIFNWIDWKPSKNKSTEDIYLVVGSILQFANKNIVVWGPGFISETCRLKEKPKKICALRGPLSRRIIVNQGIECPKIYGDPALLYPRFYKPFVKKKYKLGIIPHYVDKDNLLVTKFKKYQDILIIDIEGGINDVVDDVCSCELIASSSLHGLIVADAYGVPSTWIKFSDKIIGEGFKFRDYFASVGRKDALPLIINKKTTLQMIYGNFYGYDINIDLDKLLSICPFRK